MGHFHFSLDEMGLYRMGLNKVGRPQLDYYWWTNLSKTTTERILVRLLLITTSPTERRRTWFQPFAQDSKASKIPLHLAAPLELLSNDLSCSQNPNLKTEPPLSKVSSEGDSFGCHMYTSLAVASAQSLRLAQECLQHQYYLVQTVGHTTGSWCKGHSHTTGSLPHSHQT